MLLARSDEDLVKAALGGSERAWLKLVKRYEKRLYNYALRLSGNADDAFDIVQDVLLSVYRNLASWRGQGAFPAWLFRIAAFRSTDHLRRRRTNVISLDGEPLATSNRLEPAVRLAETRDNEGIGRLMAGLPLEQRQVVELKFFQHFTFEEIGSQLGISTNTAKTRLYTALRRMRGKTGEVFDREL